jgi:hypothetical protein
VLPYWQRVPSHNLKFIVKLVSKGTRNAPTIFQTFSLTARASLLPVFANQTNATTKNSPKKRVHGRLINSHRHRLFFERHRLIVVFIAENESNHEGAWAQATSFQTSKLIVIYSKKSLHFRKDCGMFCVGEWEEQSQQPKHDLVDHYGVIGRTDLIDLIKFVGYNGLINCNGLLDFIGVVSFFGLDRLVGIVGLSCLIGLINLIKIVKLGINGRNDLINISIIGQVGLVGLVNLSDLSGHHDLVGFFGLSLVSLVVPISFSGISGLVNQISIISLIGVGNLSL